MSAPALSLLAAVPVLLAAFAGSPHCAMMCGPLRLLAPATWRARVGYQLGRGVAYMSLGALAGRLGFALPAWAIVAVAVAALLAAALQPRLPAPLESARGKLLSFAAGRPLPLGLASALLPCGMLHAWIAVALAAATPAAGALVLAALWLGTIPALELSAWLLTRPLRAARRAFPRATLVLMLAFALAPAVWRVHFALATPVKAGEAPASCHDHASHLHH